MAKLKRKTVDAVKGTDTKALEKLLLEMGHTIEDDGVLVDVGDIILWEEDYSEYIVVEKRHAYGNHEPESHVVAVRLTPSKLLPAGRVGWFDANGNSTTLRFKGQRVRGQK